MNQRLLAPCEEKLHCGEHEGDLLLKVTEASYGHRRSERNHHRKKKEKL